MGGDGVERAVCGGRREMIYGPTVEDGVQRSEGVELEWKRSVAQRGGAGAK